MDMHIEPFFEALIGRDKAADGAFFYAVKTTGVYCLPSCAARPPRPENVAYFATREAAEAAGFRACKRCRPELAPRAEREAALVAAACRRIEAAETAPDLAALAAAAGCGASRFHRIFKAVAGVTPREYAAACREARLRETLPEAGSVTAAIYEAGFNASSRFYESAAANLGMTPRRYRDGGAGETIRFAVGRCALGLVLVAASKAGICSIALGDDEAGLVEALRGRFRQAEIGAAGAEFAAHVARVVALIDGDAKGLELPLDIRGTAFQLRVWEALRAIPAGETVSYAELARRLGAPRAVRAVAGACAANALAVAVPCHRAVREDGGLAGYRWGLKRKAALLARERDES
jgi:AraC family transcriptional regulator of adaptative response/methylated-DNA-[protein]-cysteine methyltransferase